LIAQYEGLAQREILRLETPVALLEAVNAFQEAAQTRRDGRVWRKDEHGKIWHFMPDEEYTCSDLSGGLAQAHLRDLARRCLEAALIERAGLTDDDDDSHIEWIDILAPSPSTEAALLAFAARKQADLALETGYRRLSRRERDVYDLLGEETREIATKLGLCGDTVRRLKGNIRKKIARS
jgi:DNA-binding CsgD family transcriptional regulator